MHTAFTLINVHIDSDVDLTAAWVHSTLWIY